MARAAASGLLILVACRPASPPRPAEPFTITLERGACLGGCSVYSIAVGSDGSVRYQGERNVKVEGAATGSVSPDTAATLLRALEDLAFFELPDRYVPDHPSCGAYIADLPALTLTVRKGNREKRVEYDPGCTEAPSALRELARRLDRAVESSRWTGR